MQGTKQTRYSDPSKIKTQIRDLVGKTINIVLNDNRVIFGEVKEIKAEGVVIENMRLKTVLFPFDQVSEIYFDTIV